MDIKLYYASGACSFVPHAALEAIRAATGQSFEPMPIKLHKGEHLTPEYRAINPNAQVPVLVVDGQPLNQIVAICEYLDARFPQLGLLPRDPWARARALSSLAWMNNTVHATFTHVFMPQKFAADAETQAQVKAHAVAQYRELLERIQGWLECATPWLGGDNPSFLDFYALTLFRWGGFAGIDPASLPAYRAYVERLAAHPVVAATMGRERIDLNTYKPVAA